MKILVINSGSSSIKYQVFEMPQQNVICSGMVERIGLENAKVIYKSGGNTYEQVTEVPDHRTGLQKIYLQLIDEKHGVLKSADDIDAVGHRVVHGGSTFSDTVIIDEKVKDKIKELFCHVHECLFDI